MWHGQAQTGGEQPISTLPTWSSLYLTINNSTYSTLTPSSEISNWTQSMSIADGVVQTRLSWTPDNSTAPVQLLYTIFAHRTMPNLGVVKLDIEGLASGTSVSVTDVLDVRLSLGLVSRDTDFPRTGNRRPPNRPHRIWRAPKLH